MIRQFYLILPIEGLEGYMKRSSNDIWFYNTGSNKNILSMLTYKDELKRKKLNERLDRYLNSYGLFE